MFVPSWQQLPAQRTFQQSVIPETESWGRPLVLERTALLPEQSAVIPVVCSLFYFLSNEVLKSYTFNIIIFNIGIISKMYNKCIYISLKVAV